MLGSIPLEAFCHGASRRDATRDTAESVHHSRGSNPRSERERRDDEHLWSVIAGRNPTSSQCLTVRESRKGEGTPNAELESNGASAPERASKQLAVQPVDHLDGHGDGNRDRRVSDPNVQDVWQHVVVMETQVLTIQRDSGLVIDMTQVTLGTLTFSP